MANTFLDVPFKEKDEAKALGARWDGGAKKWYAPEGKDLALFSAWLPAGSKASAPVVKPSANDLVSAEFDDTTELVLSCTQN